MRRIGLAPAFLFVALSGAVAAPHCALPAVAPVEAALAHLAVPNGVMPPLQRVRYYTLTNNGTLLVGLLLTPAVARHADLSDFDLQAAPGLPANVHLGCGPGPYAGSRATCPIILVQYDLRAQRLVQAVCTSGWARHYL